MARSSKTVAPEKKRRSYTPIVVGLCVLAIIGAVTYALVNYDQPYSPPSVKLNWRLKITFADAKTGRNTTLPVGIGHLPGVYWVNHTLDHYGNPGYAPLFTQDSTSTVYLQTNTGLDPTGFPLSFSFKDFFNIWGATINRNCVALSLTYTYCVTPTDPVVYDTNNNGAYDNGEPVVNFNVTHVVPASNTPLIADSKIMFYDANNNGVWNSNEAVIYDADGNGRYDLNDIPIAGTQVPPLGSPLSTDSRLKFVDTDGTGSWDPGQPPPVMSDGNTDQCVNERLFLANGKDWLIIINSPLGFQNGC
jgi:hypothetical protein